MGGLTDEALKFLASTALRGTILEKLQSSPRDVSSLRDTLEESRSTIHRNVSQLRDRNWISKGPNGRYRLTPLGELVVEDFRTIKETTDLVADLEEIAGALPLSEFDFDITRLRSSSVQMATEAAPFAPLTTLVTHIQNASTVQIAAPYYHPMCIDEFLQNVEFGGLQRCCMIIPATRVETFKTNHETAWRGLQRNESVDLRQVQDSIEFMIVLLDDSAIIGAYKTGTVCGIIDTTDPEIRDWVHGELQTYRRTSKPLLAEN